MKLPYYETIIQKTHTRIGCQYHSNIEWQNFSDEKIKNMDSNAVTFWNTFKTMIFAGMKSLEESQDD